jgi:hypothetical protein
MRSASAVCRCRNSLPTRSRSSRHERTETFGDCLTGDPWARPSGSVSRLAATAVGVAARAATGGIVGALTEPAFRMTMAHSYGKASAAAALWCLHAWPSPIALAWRLNESAINLRDRTAAWQKSGSGGRESGLMDHHE